MDPNFCRTDSGLFQEKFPVELGRIPRGARLGCVNLKEFGVKVNMNASEEIYAGPGFANSARLLLRLRFDSRDRRTLPRAKGPFAWSAPPFRADPIAAGSENTTEAIVEHWECRRENDKKGLLPGPIASTTRSMNCRLLLSMIALGSVAGVALAAGDHLHLEAIASGIYVHQGIHALPDRHNRGEIANIGFIVGGRCVAVVDTGGSPEQGQALKSAIQQITSVPICYVINTHMHPDHVHGNIAFRQPGISFIGHHKLGSALATHAPFYRDQASRDLGIPLTAENFVAPDREVRDTLDLDLGRRILTLRAHRTAHTDNDLSVLDHQTETLWLSDLLFIEHLPVIDGSLNGWIDELEQLRRVPAKRAVPGHGPVVTDWPAAVEPEFRYLRLLQTEIRKAIKERRTMEQAMESVGLSARNDWKLFDEFHKRNISTAFAELEWEDD